MADYFEPSPRASKRRKTTPKGETRSTVAGKEKEQSNEKSDGSHSSETNEVYHVLEDSAYGSKEDSLLEEQEGVATEDTMVIPKGHSPVVMEPEVDDDDDTIAVQPRSSGRERRKPRRYSTSPTIPKLATGTTTSTVNKQGTKSKRETKGISDGQATPKSILTPSKREKRTGPRKSVVFSSNDKEIEHQFGFRDIEQPSLTTANAFAAPSQPAAPNKKAERSVTPLKRSPKKRAAELLPHGEAQSEIENDDPLTDNFQDLVVESLDLRQDEDEIALLDINDDPSVIAAKSAILSRLIARGPAPIPTHLQSQYDTLHSLLRATVVTGESNSLVVLGARGTGKSHLLNSAISDLSLKHSDYFHTVRLNGLYQTDDRLALREIWRQLGREMQVTEMETGELGGSYADTMSSLLSLLSHPDEFVESTQDSSQVCTFRTSKSVIFILDEFDLFTTHPRQTLLYNLFDIAQSKKAPIAVIGCSTRMDVVDCLEKRVKSRFSHRWLHIPSPKTIDGFQEIVKNTLSFEDPSITLAKLNKKDMETRKRWNEYIQSTFLQSPDVRSLINSIFYTTKSIPDLLTALYIPLATLDLPISLPDNTSVHFLGISASPTTLPGLLELLPSLPTLHLSLLIAASRLDVIHNLSTMNFNLVYAHYVELLARSKLQITASGAVAVGASLRQWSRESAQSAWEDLGLHECVLPVSGAASGAGTRDGSNAGGDGAGGEGVSVRMWRVDVTLHELEWAVKEKWQESGGAREVLGKWCREI